MDDALGQNDPYRNMQTAQDNVEPGFLRGDLEGGNKKDDKNEEPSNKKKAAKAVAKGALKAAEVAAGVPVSGAAGGVADVASKEKTAGLYSGGGKSSSEGGMMKSKGVKVSAAIAVVMIVLVAVVGAIVLSTPIFTIGHIDMNLQDALGFASTTGILEKQAGHIIGEMMSKGKVPDDLAGDFAMHGMTVGQVTAQGDFVRTNVYVADVDELKDLAVMGHYQVQESDGSLAMLYKDRVIQADEFVAAIESNPEMYAAYSEALDISARYYYSDEVDDVYEEMKISRGAFEDWESTGDEEEDQEKYDEIVTEILDNTSEVVLDGCVGEEDPENYSETVSGSDDASEIISTIGQKTKGPSATAKASESLNMAISSSEPYLAANAFMAIEEPIQRTRINGDGPIHQVMNSLYEKTEVSYTDVTTGEEQTTDKAIIETDNFVAAISRGKYSKKEAQNFSRDRGLKQTGMDDISIIQDATVSSNGQARSEVLAKMQKNGGSADTSVLMEMHDSVSMAIVQNNSDLFKSTVGGNRIIEGGAFLSNQINTRALGAMPSDGDTIAAYHREVKEVLARKAAAERATKSPFDITSQYTFMGSIAHGLMNTMIRNNNMKDGTIGSVIGTIAGMTSDSVKDLSGAVLADGEEDESYEVTFGDNCATVNGVSVEGDIYCTAHTTISTGYMKKTAEEWEDALGGNLDGSGGIVPESELGQFVVLGMDRRTTVGVENAEVCEAYKEFHDRGIIGKIIDKILGLLGLYESCSSVPADIANGASYTLGTGAENVDLYSGFVLYDTVSSLLSGETSSVSAFREKYYQEHPLDNSAAGIIARISGMSKKDAQLALNYASYLNMIARYDPSTRYVFGEVAIDTPAKTWIDQVNELAVELYIIWHGRTEYDDLRGRNYVA